MCYKVLHLSIPFGMLQSYTIIPEEGAQELSIPFGMLRLASISARRPWTLAFNSFWDATEQVGGAAVPDNLALSIPFGMLLYEQVGGDYDVFVAFNSFWDAT